MQQLLTVSQRAHLHEVPILEVELNDRQNSQGTDNGNGVWQLSLDYLFKSNIRFSLNYLFDEFTLDK